MYEQCYYVIPLMPYIVHNCIYIRHAHVGIIKLSLISLKYTSLALISSYRISLIRSSSLHRYVFYITPTRVPIFHTIYS